MPLWIASNPIIIPVLLLLIGVGSLETTIQVLYSVWGWFYRAFIVIIIYGIASQRYRSGLKRPLFCLIFLLFFFLFHSIATHFSIDNLYENVTNAFYVLVPFVMMMVEKRCLPKLSVIFTTIIIVYIFQLLFIPLNTHGIFFYTARPELFLSNPGEMLLMPGSFLQSNQLADFVGITYLFICIDYFYRRRIKKQIFVYVTIAVMILLAFSGSKTPTILFLFTIVSAIYLFNPKARLIIAILAVGAVVGIISLNQVNEIDTGNDGLNRVLNEIISLVQIRGNINEDNTTLRISSMLLDKYFMRSPFIGNGLSYIGENAYPINDFISNVSAYKADARLAYTLVEFGILGLLVMLFYYYSVI